jgi:hypothetical protein
MQTWLVQWIVGVVVLERVSQKDSRWSSENMTLGMESMGPQRSLVMMVCIARREAEGGDRRSGHFTQEDNEVKRERYWKDFQEDIEVAKDNEVSDNESCATSSSDEGKQLMGLQGGRVA